MKPASDLRSNHRTFQPLRFVSRLLGIVFVALLMAGAAYYLFDVGVRQTVQGVLAGVNPRSAFHADAVNLLILGKDEDRDNRKQVMDTNGRSDTIILARLDFQADTLQLLSIPRDTRVRIPGYRGYHKINSAHAIGGPDLAVDTIDRFLGVQADKTLVVDYTLLQKVIDAVGGVRVNVDKALDYDDNWGDLHIHLKPGWQTLNGKDAMGFVRFRHSNEGGGDSDLVRIGRQQSLLQGLKARLQEPATWVRIPHVLEIVRTEMKGSLTYPQLLAIAQFARSIPKENIQNHTLPTRPGRSFVYAEREEALALVARLFPDSSENSTEVASAGSRRTAVPRTVPHRAIRLIPPVADPAPEHPVEADGKAVPEEHIDLTPIEDDPVPAPEPVEVEIPQPEPVITEPSTPEPLVPVAEPSAG